MSSGGFITTNSRFSKSITLKVLAPGSYDADGLYVPGSEAATSITASVQPMRPDEMLLLPEGIRTREGIKIYTDIELSTADEASKAKGDVVVYNGVSYEVQKVKRYDMGTLDHFRAFAVRFDA